MQKTKTPPTNHELRVFSVILTIGFSVIGGLIPYLKKHEMNFPLLILAGVIFITGMGLPKAMIKPREVWMKIGNVLGRINSTIIFTVIYFLIFTTVGWIFRFMKRDRLKKKFKGVDSTLVVKDSISAFEDPF